MTGAVMSVFSQILANLDEGLSEATITTVAIHLFWALALIWWLFGFAPMALTALAINQLITYLGDRRYNSANGAATQHDDA